MPVTNTDAVLWYDVGIFGEIGYAVPNPSDDLGSLNGNILDFVHLAGGQLFAIMHHEDADLRIPPSVNTLRRVHKLYLRASQLLAARAVPPGELNMETVHIQPGGDVFRVFPVPYFRVRNPYMRRWAQLTLTMISEAMQHTENRKGVEISTGFAGLMGQYLTRIYQNMGAELFGKTRDEVREEGFILSDADFAGYDPGKFFTGTEMVDTVPPLNRVLTEDRLSVLREGIPLTDLPELKPWPVNLTRYYDTLRPGGRTPAGEQEAGGAAASSADTAAAKPRGPILPAPPSP